MSKPRPTVIAIIGGRPRSIPKPTAPRRGAVLSAAAAALLALSGCGLFQGASTRVTPAASRVDVTTVTEVEVTPPKESPCDRSSPSSD